jgi:2-aminophenol/2-amino-5-chlorophenol 1,6-dioxygenase alpha subunit
MTSKRNLTAAAIVAGLPHLLEREANAGYEQLARAMEALGDDFERRGVKRILYYSTQWISVLGHSFQARSELTGHHVDENWYELPDLPFSFRVDRPFAERLAKSVEAKGHQARLIDYDGFPVDTGTIVADRLLNRGRFVTGMVSCCVYSDFEDTVQLASTLAEALAEDATPTAVVCVSMLSGRWFTRAIDPREDHVSSPEDDACNRRLIQLLEAGQAEEVEAYLPAYNAAVKADMGMKALAFLKGFGAFAPGRKARLRAYGALYGTGAAVIEM